MGESIEIFFSYAREDELLRDELAKQLRNWERQGFITVWHDRNISAGTEWASEIDTHLNTAQIILLLISPDFMNSDYCYSGEMERALGRHATGEARVIPILLRPVLWKDTPFSTLQVLPRNGSPVTNWHNRDEAFFEIATEIRSVIEELTVAHKVIPRSMDERPLVFLAYSRTDSELVARLRTDLQVLGVNIWIDREGLQPGTLDWEEAVREAIRAAQAVLLIASPNARSSRYVKDELRIAEMYQRLVYPIWVAGVYWIDAIPLGWGGMQYIDAREASYQRALSEIVAVLGTSPGRAPLMSPKTPEVGFVPRNPYKGLRAFTGTDASDFFGRDKLIDELIQALKASLVLDEQSARLLAVIGSSGSGKSSVVKAGLLPHLQAGKLPGSREWVYLESIVPDIDPIEPLMHTLAKKLDDKSLKMIREDLEDESALGLHRLAGLLARSPNEKVVLFIDQFEKIFTQTITEGERRHFIDLLVTAITKPQGQTLVILTLRADFYDRLTRYSELALLIKDHHQLVLPMNMKELRAVIEQPAILPDVQLLFEGDLVGDLLFESQGQAGTLPLLEFTLDQLFHQRDGHRLTHKAYQQIGGLKGALAKHAETTYTTLPSDRHRELARALFLRLIDLGVTEQDTTRRRAMRSELVLDDPFRTRLLQEIVDTFIAARLLATNEIAGTTTIEVSHEALIREWKRLADWLREAREDIHLQNEISENAAEWERRGRPRDRLYRGSQLKEANEWVKRNVPNRREVTFLQASTRRRVLSTLSVVVVVLLLLSTTGLASWFLLHPSVEHPPVDPTRVTTSNDDGVGSLRWAIITAKAGSTITFDTSSLRKSVIFLTSNDLTFTKNMIIRGPGAQSLAISGGKSGKIVRVLPGVAVTIFDLSFINSNTGQTGVGFIKNEGTLTLTNCTVSGNMSTDIGGGITNFGGKLTLVNSTVSRNSSQEGGGIYNYTMSVLTLVQSTISENMASDEGGGIYDYESRDHQSILISCNISDNTAKDGGGIFVDGGHPVETRDCHITGNHAPTHADIAGTIIPSQ